MTSSLPFDPPGIADIEAAAGRLKGRAVRTPLLESPLLNERLGFRLLVKAEPLQLTGSFKFRGAWNFISQLSADQRERGVIAYSSGNHAQGVAAASRLAGVKATIAMPADAPRIKAGNTRAWGAEIVTYDRFGDEDREEFTAKLIEARGGTLVPPFEHPVTIAGQGTVGLELAAQAADAGAALDAVVVPCGGGGLIAGCATALAARMPGVPVYAAEPEGFDDTARSLASGKRQRVDPDARSICDALLSPAPGVLTLAINRERLAGGLVVSDGEAGAAMRLAFLYLKLVVEPGGAVALAAAATGKLDCRGKTIAVVASGGNVDPQTYRDILAGSGE